MCRGRWLSPRCLLHCLPRRFHLASYSWQQLCAARNQEVSPEPGQGAPLRGTWSRKATRASHRLLPCAVHHTEPCLQPRARLGSRAGSRSEVQGAEHCSGTPAPLPPPAPARGCWRGSTAALCQRGVTCSTGLSMLRSARGLCRGCSFTAPCSRSCRHCQQPQGTLGGSCPCPELAARTAHTSRAQQLCRRAGSSPAPAPRCQDLRPTGFLCPFH